VADLSALERSLAIARAGLAPPEAARARIRAKLGAAALPASLPSATEVPAAAKIATAAKAGGVTKLTTAALVGVGFVAGYWLGLQHSTEPPVMAAPTGLPMPAAQTASSLPPAIQHTAPSEMAPESPANAAVTAAAGTTPAATATASAPRPGLDSPTPGGQRAAHSHTQPRRAASGRAIPTSTPDPFAEELALLERAERAIRSDQAALALSFLEELDQRFPKSSLLEERTAARVLAGCALGEPLARTRAELFLRDRQASVYTDRVRRLCKLDVSTPTLP